MEYKQVRDKYNEAFGEFLCRFENQNLDERKKSSLEKFYRIELERQYSEGQILIEKKQYSIKVYMLASKM